MATSEGAPLKVVFIGDGATGKTCFLIVAVLWKFPTEYVPTVFDQYTKVVSFNGRNHNLAFWDTPGGHFDL